MIAAIIQARMGSTRLLNKVMLPLGETTVLGCVIRRLKQCKTLNKIIVATTAAQRDLPIVETARNERVSWSMTCSEEDVLRRYYDAAKKFKIDVIVRITADCPCVDPDIVDDTVRLHLEGNAACTFNRNDNMTVIGVLDGLDVEVFNFEALEEAFREATSPYDREHVTSYMYANFDCEQLDSFWSLDCDTKLSINTEEDYKNVCQIYKQLGSDFRIKDIAKYYAEQSHDTGNGRNR